MLLTKTTAQRSRSALSDDTTDGVAEGVSEGVLIGNKKGEAH